MADQTICFVETEAQLAPLLNVLDTTSPLTLAIDTEFVRTSTFYARLGLLQIFDGTTCYLVDPVKLDLSPLWPLLRQHHWVLHAFSEDLEILLRKAGGFGLSVFDTQLGAAFMGHGISMGYQKFIEMQLGLSLDKGEARTDWLARPLRQAQLDYAALDVIYLLPAYEKLKVQLEACGRWSGAQEESTRLSEAKKAKAKSELAYLDIKNAWRLNPAQLAVLQVLAQWRIKEAERRDMAINRVIKGEVLWNLARFSPTSMKQLSAQGLSDNELRFHGQRLLKLIDKANKLAPEQYPPQIVRMIDHSGYKQAMAALKTLISEVATAENLPEDVIASKKLMHQYLSWRWKTHEELALPILLQGWRGELLTTPLANLTL